MIDYTRKRFKALKRSYPEQMIILSQDEAGSRFWTYDDDAVLISKEVGAWPFFAKKGLGLVLDADEFSADKLRPIPGEEGAFFFDPVSMAFPAKHKGEEIFPPSALARVTLTHGLESTTRVIVSSSHDQDSKKQIFWAGRADYARILRAIAEHESEVELGTKPGANGSVWQITDYVKTNAFPDYIDHLEHFLDIGAGPETIIICDTLTKSMMEEVSAFFFTSKYDAPVPMTVFYSPEDGGYYLDISTYSGYRDKYGLPYVKLSPAAKGKKRALIDLAEQSELFLYGYSVSQKDSLSESQRRKLLADLMDTGLMAKREIENHISWLIQQNGNNPLMENALSSWRKDILFVNTYNMQHKKEIWIKSFAAKYKK